MHCAHLNLSPGRTQLRADTHKCHGYLGSRALTFARVRWHSLHGPLLTLLVNRLHGAILTPRSSTPLYVCDGLFMVFLTLVGKLPLKLEEEDGRNCAKRTLAVHLHLGVENESLYGVAQLMNCSERYNFIRSLSPWGVLILRLRINNLIITV